MAMENTMMRLRALKRSVLADGQVDWDETARLLATIRPLAAKHGIRFQDYERLLEKCRADGKITREESDQLAQQLDYLCKCLVAIRVRMVLIVAVVLLALGSLVVVGWRVLESTDGSALAPERQD